MSCEKGNKTEKSGNTKRVLLLHLAAAAGLALYIAALVGLQIYCPIRRITGIPCPGCGMFRALCVLLRGDIALSWRLHPLLLPTLAGTLFLLHARPPYVPRWVNVTVGCLLAAALAAVYAVRLACGTIP